MQDFVHQQSLNLGRTLIDAYSLLEVTLDNPPPRPLHSPCRTKAPKVFNQHLRLDPAQVAFGLVGFGVLGGFLGFRPSACKVSGTLGEIAQAEHACNIGLQ